MSRIVGPAILAAHARPRPAAPAAASAGAGGRWSYLGHDLIAALVLTTLLVPAGMAYAELAGLPAVSGLYATIAALLAYAGCGASRTLIMGPDSSLAPVVAAAVVPLAGADTGVLAQTLAALDGDKPRPTREMAALGVTNLATGAFGGFPVSGSTSRTPVARQSGARTRLTGALAGVLVAVVLIAFPGATSQLPSAALAAVVLVAAGSLIDVRGFGRLRAACPASSPSPWRPSPESRSSVCSGASAWRWGSHWATSWPTPGGRMWPNSAGSTAGRDTTTSSAIPKEGGFPGVIARFDAPLFFANASASPSSSSTSSRRHLHRSAGWSSPPNPSPTSTSPPPTRSSAWTDPCTGVRHREHSRSAPGGGGAGPVGVR